MYAVFLDEEKAEKYAEVHSKLDGYDDYWVVEYETEDDKFDMNTEVNKYYSCTIRCKDWTDGNGNVLQHAGEIESDELWESFMAHFNIKRFEDLSPKKYGPLVEYEYSSIDKAEEDYCCTIENQASNEETIISPFKAHNSDDLIDITVYSRESYAKARKIAIEQYQIFTQQQLEDGTIG
jgi:hypothetical protein